MQYCESGYGPPVARLWLFDQSVFSFAVPVNQKLLQLIGALTNGLFQFSFVVRQLLSIAGKILCPLKHRYSTFLAI